MTHLGFATLPRKNSIKCCGFEGGKNSSWRIYQGSAINSAHLCHQVQLVLGRVTCQTCSHPTMKINGLCFAWLPFTWGEPYMHRLSHHSLSWPRHHLTAVPGLGKGTAHPECPWGTSTLCDMHGVRTKPTLGVGSSWSCGKKANISLLFESEKCPSTGSTQLS